MVPCNDNFQHEQDFILKKAREMLIKCGYVEPVSISISISGLYPLLNNAFGTFHKITVSKA